MARCLGVALAATLVGCGLAERNENLERLNDRIEQLGGPDAYPVVPVDLFFDGNNDPASIAPNLEPHPGVDAFGRILRQIRDREDVSDVVMQIDEVIPGEWPYASGVYVITRARPEMVHEWAAELRPDEYVGAEDEIGRRWSVYPGEGTPPGAPAVPDGHQIVTLFWD